VPGIRRVSVSLNEQEYQQLVIVAESLGIKATTAAHRALMKGLVVLSKDAEALQVNIRNLKLVGQWTQADIVQETNSVSKKRTNVQRKQDAKKNKKKSP